MKIRAFFCNIMHKFDQSFKRFPVTIILAALTVIAISYHMHSWDHISDDSKNMYWRIIMIMGMGLPLSLCIQFLAERYIKMNLAIKIASYAAGAAVLCLYYFLLLNKTDMVSVTRYIALSIFLWVITVIITYFWSKIGLEMYVVKLFIRYLTTAMFSIVLFLGIEAILFALNVLLELDMNPQIYFDAWLAVVGIFAPSFFLAGIPAPNVRLEQTEYPKLLKILLLYIVMPLIGVYTAILYLYSAKILVTLQWPDGIVTNLVLWYAVISIAVLFMICPNAGESKWVRIFIFWLPKLILPLFVMMFISIGMRIVAYGITENRYFILALSIWALIVMIYMNFNKFRFNIAIPLLLAAVILISVAGPFSSYRVSISSQNAIFKSVLVKNGMLGEDMMIKANPDISDDDKSTITGILEYFDNSHDLSDLKYLPENFRFKEMANVFGFESSRYWSDSNRKHFYFVLDINDAFIETKGYDYIKEYHSYMGSIDRAGESLISFDKSNKHINITLYNIEIYDKDLTEFVKKFYSEHSSEINNTAVKIDRDEMTFSEENDKVAVKLVFTDIYGFADKGSNKLDIDSLNFYLLVAFK